MTANKPRNQMRLLHMPNEWGTDMNYLQLGPRDAFKRFLEEGEIAALHTFSFLEEAKKVGGSEQAMKKLVEEAEEFQPDVIFWQHIERFFAPEESIKALKNISSKPKLVYHEGDPFGRYLKRINKNLQIVLRQSDMVFLEGLGKLADLMRENGAKDVYFAPTSFDKARFGLPWTPTPQRKYSIAMIGNRGKTRIPGLYFPGGKRRKEMAEKLDKVFGERFALYGYGWEKLTASRGKVPYIDQQKRIQEAWISVNWDHFDHFTFYFSDRLPISLAAGVPHITTYHPGFDEVCRHCEGGLYLAHDVDEAVDMAQYLMSMPRDFLIEEGIKARDFAFKYLDADVVYRNIIDRVKDEYFAVATEAAVTSSSVE